jgi:hypothetical protein
VPARVYLLFTVLGLVVPPALLGIWVADHGFDLGEMLDSGGGNLVALAVFCDLSISALVFWVWSYGENRRLALGSWWWNVPATIFIGLCFTFPLFMYRRQLKLDAGAAPA